MEQEVVSMSLTGTEFLCSFQNMLNYKKVFYLQFLKGDEKPSVWRATWI